jgi:hypothetical protein
MKGGPVTALYSLFVSLLVPGMGVGSLDKAFIVWDDIMGNGDIARYISNRLRHEGFEVENASFDEISDPRWWEDKGDAAIAIPDARRFPFQAMGLVVEFLKGGGKLLVFGLPAFQEPMFKLLRPDGEARWITWKEIEAMRKCVNPQNLIFEELEDGKLRLWRRFSSDPEAESRISMEPVSGLPTPYSIRFEISLKGWDIFVRDFAKSPFPSGHSLTCFWARSRKGRGRLMVEWREGDGSRWYAHISLTKSWRLYVLSPHDFRYRPDSVTGNKRGWKGDVFDPGNASQLVFGMEAPMPPGRHTIWVSGVGTAPDPFPDIPRSVEIPKLEALCPAYKIYPVRKTGRKVFAPIPRHSGIGFVGKRPYRLKALGKRAWCLLHFGQPYRGAAWIAIGGSEGRYLGEGEKKGAIRSAVSELKRLMDEPVLAEAGANVFTAYEGERISLGAKVFNMSLREASCIVELVLLLQDGGVLHSIREEVLLGPRVEKEVLTEVEGLHHGEYEVVARIIRGGEVKEELRHTLNVIERPCPSELDLVSVKDGHFVLGGRRWFAFGVNFWPRYSIGLEPEDFFRHWLDPIFYDPSIVEEDLEIVRKMGMNCVSIQYLDPSQAPSLLDFLTRCRRKGIKVNLFIAGAHPLRFRPDLVSALIRAADLPNQPSLFAYDVAWEPVWGLYEERRRFDQEWRLWIQERYGGIEKAEEDWGIKAPRDEHGFITGPMDEQVTSDGPWRRMVAAYRRFQDDLLSRRYMEVRRFIRSIDPNHLIGARTGWGGGPFINSPSMPFDLSSGAKHLDFISPEAWNLGWLSAEGRKGVRRALLVSSYARMVSHGKPVLWAEFGLTLNHGDFDLKWYEDKKRLKAQARHYRNIYEVVMEGDSDGAIAWWFPGGYRVDERTDFGIVSPDGRIRQAGVVARSFSKKLRGMAGRKVSEWIVVDRDEDARGPFSIWLKHADEVAGKKGMVGLRTEGTGSTSGDCPRISIGNTDWVPGKPPKFLNAEFNAVYVEDGGWREVRRGEEVRVSRGKPLKIVAEVGNTGEATWLPPEICTRGVFLWIRIGERVVLLRPIPQEVKPFSDVKIEGISVPPDLEGDLSISMAWREGPFGEVFQIKVRRIE